MKKHTQRSVSSTVYGLPEGSQQAWAGEAVGIIVLDARYPCIPGNVANATTFDFPVRYQRIQGSSIDALLYEQSTDQASRFIEAAQALERDGVKAIAGACGFMALFQQEVSASVNIPVFLTSLLQVPFVHTITQRPVGVITADARSLSRMSLEHLGIKDNMIISTGMENCPEFSSAILGEKGTLDSEKIEAEACEKARILKEENPDIGSILLECSDLPPYAHSIQKATGLPVFDYTTMIRHVAGSLTHRPYLGFF